MLSLYVWTSIFGVLGAILSTTVTCIVTPIDLALSLLSCVSRRKARDPKTILITGATSGIGEALAKSYAEGAGVTLALTGRDDERLGAVAKECSAKGATVITKTIDVADEVGMREWIQTVDERYPIDMVVANAGVSEATAKVKNDSAQAARIVLPINITGVVNTVAPLIDPMKSRGSGQIVLLSSLAGFGPITASSAYSASKTFVKTWGEALRTELACFGVDVNVICPGFVRSPMTAVNTMSMPGLIEMEACIKYIREGIDTNAPVTAFPPQMYGLVHTLGTLPTTVRDALARWGATSGIYFYRRKPRGSKSD